MHRTSTIGGQQGVPKVGIFFCGWQRERDVLHIYDIDCAGGRLPLLQVPSHSEVGRGAPYNQGGFNIQILSSVLKTLNSGKISKLSSLI